MEAIYFSDTDPILILYGIGQLMFHNDQMMTKSMNGNLIVYHRCICIPYYAAAHMRDFIIRKGIERIRGFQKNFIESIILIVEHIARVPILYIYVHNQYVCIRIQLCYHLNKNYCSCIV